MTELQWNWVLNLEPSDPKAETLPLGHHSLKNVFKFILIDTCKISHNPVSLHKLYCLLNHGQMMRTTPEPLPLSTFPCRTIGREFDSDGFSSP
ncbi:hypothetical protein AVEN_2353-1 [Araneus ventricosus]|uniref:Uncharacterized protein n=1 Tax=Araneus ventricosus TaxID=182803 RepID=A0A4Y2JUN6_ARAVE|nr:hypothetical protein AVEN_2353-1 [Araneus ventricosus]